MRPNLLWLDDHQWQQIEPHLPTDMRGKERADDRRVISGILHVLRSGVGGRIARRSTVRTRRSTMALRGGLNGASGRSFSGSLRFEVDRARRK